MNGLPESDFPRDPATGIIQGAEPFSFGAGRHAVLFLHGWTSSPRELRFMAQRVAEAGFHCRGILLPGHGTRVADLQALEFQDHLAAAETAFDDLAQIHDRVSLCGLSLGGLLCLYLAARRRTANIILYAPFLIPGGTTWGLPNRLALSLFGPFIPPDRLMPKKGVGPIFDPQALREHIAYASMPMRGILSNFRAAKAIWPRIPNLTNPLLVFQSRLDPTSDFSGASRVMQNAGSKDKRLVETPHSKHVITLDRDRARIEEETLRWISERRDG